jgi:prepilin-type N-terminal cleavage/methylation domain-containing protein
VPEVPARDERGLTIVEMLVVLLIIAILMAAMLYAFRGSKQTTYYKAAIAAAQSYSDGIEAFMADNGQTPPRLGTTDWPNANRAKRVAGPVNSMLVDAATHQPKTYMRAGSLDAIQNGTVDFGTSKASAPATARAYITYQVVGSDYRLVVETLPSSGGKILQCVVTNAASLPTGMKRC